MKIGVPAEVKSDEYRVAMLPVGADLLTQAGHEVFIEHNAGIGSGFTDDNYRNVGATIVDTGEEVYAAGDLIVKVKEPQAEEIKLLRKGQTLFTYFHFAASEDLTRGCLEAGITALAYETLRDAEGRLPLLTPMSEVAGRMSIQQGAKYLEKPQLGRGILLGGVPGVAPANVIVIGGGVVGYNAARVAAGLGANVVIMDVNLDRLRYLDDIMPANVSTRYSDPHAIDHFSKRADLLIGAVLIPGERAPHLLTTEQLKKMKNGSVIVDVSIDQGGCFETSRPTTHKQPTYVVEDVVHYCVANIPGAVSRTSTRALCNATFPYVHQLVSEGLAGFLGKSENQALALNMLDGVITHPAVARAFPDLSNNCLKH